MLNPRSLGLGLVGLVLGTIVVSGQPGKQATRDEPLTWTVGQPSVGEVGIQKTTAVIMSEPGAREPRKHIYKMPEFEVPIREHRQQDPNAVPLAQYPPVNVFQQGTIAPMPRSPQPIALNFDAVTGPNQTGSFQPDTMGAVGPTQFILAVNGRIRTFTKNGVADAVLDVDTDVFFASVMTPLGGGIGLNFTNDPQIRYDRLSGRWFITIADVPSTSPTSVGDHPNRLLFAVSDGPAITGATVWTFYFVQQDMLGTGGTSTGNFCDYPSLGIDNNALYMGGDMFAGASGSYMGTDGFVIRKSSLLSGGPVVATAFRQLCGAATEGPFAPRGVDNYNPTANEGYFIGVSNIEFARLDLRRVADPGGTPTISSNVLLTVPTTSYSISVDHLGNTGGTNGRLDGLADDLFAAQIRSGRLWTAHGNAVTSTGVSSNTNTQRRNGVRWYEINVPVGSGSLTLVQSGTVFDTASTVATARQYWIPTVMVSGQGHAAFGYSTAGTPFRADAATNGRLRTDTLGTSRTVSIYTSSTTAYNPSGDDGSDIGFRRWGDYSFTCLDPLDDMTFWTIQEYCDGTNTYGCQAAKLLAPPPATPTSASPSTIAGGQTSVNVTITGTSSAGSEFYDPGTNLAAPAVPFTHISASVSGGVVVNSVTYNSATSVTLNLNTIAASGGAKDVTITDPDGQSLTGVGILNVTVTAPLTISGAVSRKTHGTAGTFDINLPLSGEPGLESRSSGGNHTMVITFSNDVVSGNATLINGTGSVSGSPIFSANTMTVNLTGVTNAQMITVRLSGVTDTMSQVLPDTDINMNILIGDVNVNKVVNATDVSQTKSSPGAPVDGTNFRTDIDASGSINATDIGLVKSMSGTALSPGIAKTGFGER